jgi:hypothetical protein
LTWALQSNDVVTRLNNLLIDSAATEDDTVVEALMKQLDQLLIAENGVLAQIGVRREKAILEGDGKQLLPDNEIIHDIARWKSTMELSTAPYPLSPITDDVNNAAAKL